MSTNNEGEGLQRGLKARHLSMIALGGAIGTGIFLAMGGTIHQAGVGGAFLAYAIVGVMVYFLCTGLGEMATYLPETGSFGSYSTKFIDPALGFAMGWNYWYNWAITIAAEMVAGSIVMKFWYPQVPAVAWSALFLLIIVGLNLLSARAYGESEFWFATIKVITVIIFLVVGVLMIIGILGGKAEGFTKYFQGGGPFIGGSKAVFAIFLVAGFSFQGTELIGLAAGESENPERDVPRAVNTIFWRIVLFYLGTIIIIGAIIAPSELTVTTSAFTLVFERLGIAGAASIMNAVILTSVLSAGNSGMYASSRMLYAMSKDGMAPKAFGKVNKRGVPVNAILLTTVVASISFLTGSFGDGTVYTWLVAASGLSGFIAWLGIAMCHYRFRRAYVAQGKKIKDLPYKAKLFPLGPIIAFVLCFVSVIGQGYASIGSDGIEWGNLISAYVGIPLFLIIFFTYKIKHKTKLIPLDKVDLRRLEK
ncbi:amino acid permease [uncultured Clostridium sp.]|jgi:lysine-specific permease|uniref:amino acid permease n=1 Tax=uncultured Clostridium sp. TaxID=59620 RepID=UPI002637EC09|nr:amino acid permease [uncultured Clostridium sp.]